MSAPLAEVVSERGGELTVLAVTGEVDLSNVADIATAIRRCVPSSQEMLLDLSGVEYLDSTAIAMLDGLHQERISAHIVAPPECAAARLLAMVDLGLPTYETRGSAAEGLRSGRSGSAQ